jgi:hypothetical protein
MGEAGRREHEAALRELREQGLLNDDEFQAELARLSEREPELPAGALGDAQPSPAPAARNSQDSTA